MPDYMNESATANINNVLAMLYCATLVELTDKDRSAMEARLKAAVAKLERVKEQAVRQSMRGASFGAPDLVAKCRGLL